MRVKPHPHLDSYNIGASGNVTRRVFPFNNITGEGVVFAFNSVPEKGASGREIRRKTGAHVDDPCGLIKFGSAEWGALKRTHTDVIKKGGVKRTKSYDFRWYRVF